ncbi:MAG: hypothetical protein ACOY0T_33435 [Myxococcota bacterium]
MLDGVANALTNFRATPVDHFDATEPREVEIVGALAGYLSKILPDASVELDVQLIPDRAFRVDIVLRRESQLILVEVKRARPGTMQLKNALNQVTHYMALGGAKEARVFFYSSDGGTYQIEDHRRVQSTAGAAQPGVAADENLASLGFPS